LELLSILTPKIGKDRVIQVEKEQKFDIISDYLRICRNDTDAQHLFEVMMTTLEEGIGVYQLREQRAWRELFFPTVWLAYIIRLPITVLQRAGIRPSDKLVTDIYGRLIQAGTLILIVLLSIKLGVTIPWERLITYFVK
jgi:hypothetical protein